MVPAQQCLHPGDAPGAEVELRLIVERELPFGQGPLEIPSHRAPLLQLGVHAELEKPVDVPSLRLRPVQRHVRTAQHMIRLRPGIRTGTQCDADAHANCNGLRFQVERHRQGADRTFGEARSPRWLLQVVEDDRELVAAQPRQGVGLTHLLPQPLRDLIAAGRPRPGGPACR